MVKVRDEMIFFTTYSQKKLKDIWRNRDLGEYKVLLLTITMQDYRIKFSPSKEVLEGNNL